jgi:transposase
MHTLLDVRGNIPVFIRVTHALVHDVNLLDWIIPEAGSFYIMDRAYIDYARLYRIHQASAFFVTHARKSFRFGRLYSRPVDKSSGLRCDQSVKLMSFYPLKAYPEKLRRIRYVDAESGNRFIFITNCFTLPAYTITQIYKCRWQIELFFKWIKQHLRIKAFYGTSENAVKTQIWIASSVYVFVAIIKKRLQIDLSLYTILQILSVTLFEKTPILQALSQTDYTIADTQNRNQLMLFDL